MWCRAWRRGTPCGQESIVAITGSESNVQGVGCKVQSPGLRGSGFGVWGVGFEVKEECRVKGVPRMAESDERGHGAHLRREIAQRRVVVQEQLLMKTMQCERTEYSLS